jgi:hypothetical protein
MPLTTAATFITGRKPKIDAATNSDICAYLIIQKPFPIHQRRTRGSASPANISDFPIECDIVRMAFKAAAIRYLYRLRRRCRTFRAVMPGVGTTHFPILNDRMMEG